MCKTDISSPQSHKDTKPHTPLFYLFKIRNTKLIPCVAILIFPLITPNIQRLEKIRIKKPSRPLCLGVLRG